MKITIEFGTTKKLIGRFFYYFKIWLMMSKNSILIMLSQKPVLLLFLTAKLFRFGFFFAFLYFLVLGSDNLAGYTPTQTIFFFLTFNVIDVISQFLFREAYRFRQLIVNGDFDLILVKPANALFRVLMGGADIVDLVTIPPLLFAVWYVGTNLAPSGLGVLLYIALVINGLLIATAFHIAVLSLGIITLEIDHTIMIYRDLTNLGRLPTDIYRQPLNWILTYLIPVGIMITLPSRALYGLASAGGVLLAFAVGAFSLLVSLKFWNFAVKKYTSASS